MPDGFTLDPPPVPGGAPLDPAPPSSGFKLDPAPEPPDTGFTGAIGSAISSNVRGLKQTGQLALGQQVDQPQPPQSLAEQPMSWADLKHPKALAEKAVYGVTESFPEMGAFFLGSAPGAAAGAAATAETGPFAALGALLGGTTTGAIAAGAVNVAKTLGPYYAEALQQNPDDPHGAFDRALIKAGTSGAITGVTFKAFEIAPFKGAVQSALLKAFGFADRGAFDAAVKETAATGQQLAVKDPAAAAEYAARRGTAGAKDLALQAFGVQPAVAVAGHGVQNIEEGRPAQEGALDVVPGAFFGTATPALAHAAAARTVGALRRGPAEAAAGTPPEAPETPGTAPAGKPDLTSELTARALSAAAVEAKDVDPEGAAVMADQAEEAAQNNPNLTPEQRAAQVDESNVVRFPTTPEEGQAETQPAPAVEPPAAAVPAEPAPQPAGTPLAGGQAIGLTPKDPSRVKAAADKVLPVIAKMFPGAETRFYDAIRATAASGQEGAANGFFQTEPGQAVAHIINLSLGSPDVVGTARHEGIHYLKEARILNPTQWGTLEQAAQQGGWVTDEIRQLNPKLNEKQLLEEAVAEQFANWQRGERGQPPGVKGIFYNLGLFLRRVGVAARGALGKKATADDIFHRIESGDIGQQKPGEARPEASAPEGAPAAPQAAGATGDGSPASPIKLQRAEDLDAARDRIDKAPTEGEKRAGNYSKLHTSFQGLPIAIENGKGSVRRGVDAEGKPWAATLPTDYGYIKRTEGADGDHVDSYVGPNPKSDKVYVVDQKDLGTGKFDEHKAMLGYDTVAQAAADYQRAFSDGRGMARLQGIHEMSMAQFKDWLKRGDTKTSLLDQLQARRNFQDLTRDQEARAANLAEAERQGYDVKQPWYVGSPTGGQLLESGAFDPRRMNPAGLYGPAVYLSTEPREAAYYAKAGVTGQRIPVPESEQEPRVFRVAPKGEFLKAMQIYQPAALARFGIEAKDGMSGEEIYHALTSRLGDKSAANRFLQQRGIAGIYHTRNNLALGQRTRNLALFDPANLRRLDAGFDATKAGQSGLMFQRAPSGIDVREHPDAYRDMLDDEVAPTRAVGQLFDELWQKRNPGQMYGDPADKKQFRRAVDHASREAQYQLEQAQTGEGWYDSDVALAFEHTAKVIPQLKDDKKLRILFTAMAAGTSYGTRPGLNWREAASAMQHYLATGRVPDNNPETGGAWSGVKGPSKAGSMRLIDFLVRKLGKDGAADWLTSEHTVKEVRDMKAASGLYKSPPKVIGKATDTVYGALALGDKAGPFMMNINGVRALTVDSWMTRAFNRHFGRMTGPTAVAESGLIDAPTGEANRNQIKKWIGEVGDNINASPQEAQAVLWYYEQQLFHALGVESAKPEKFSDGAKEFARRAGHSTEAGQPEGAGADAGGDHAEDLSDRQTAVPRAAFQRAGRDTGAGGAGGDQGLREAQEAADKAAGGERALRGLPQKPIAMPDGTTYVPGPLQIAHDAARDYMKSAGLPYNPPKTYAKVDEERAGRIAQAYDAMTHDPHDPEVKRAYDAMIAETAAQYDALLKSGLKVEFIPPGGKDPYGNPRAATKDVRDNNHLWVFSTRDGFGSDATFDASKNPLLQQTEHQISGQPALANDLFRVVHDYFGHIKDGNGFRAGGEENAWRSHAAMYSPEARRAMTSETRGQNSWVNYGPHGETNRTASAADTTYADQKIGLLPKWVSEEGAGDEAAPKFQRAGDERRRDVTFEVAPDPADKALKTRWDALSQPDRTAITRAVAGDVVPRAMKMLGVRGQLRDQLGGWMDDTNPSLSLRLDRASPKRALQLTGVLGHALGQAGMMYTSDAPFAGGTKMGAVIVHLGKDAPPDLVDQAYRQIRSLVDDSGSPYVSGHTTVDGDMVILNDEQRIARQDLARKIADLQQNRYDVDTDVVFAQFPEKGEDSYGWLSGREKDLGGSSEPSLRRSVDTLRREAAARLEQEIAARERGAQGGGSGQADTGVVRAPAFQRAPEEEKAKPFFSQLTRQVENLKLAKAHPSQWLGTLEGLKGKGVKEEELAWSGVRDWLKDQKGLITKDQVLGHLRENEVQLQEVTKGGPGFKSKADEDRYETLHDKLVAGGYVFHGEEVTERGERLLERGAADPEEERARQMLREYTDLRDTALGAPGKTKFGSYQLPGGKNYREMLLTKAHDTTAAKAAFDAARRRQIDLLDALKRANDEYGRDDPRALGLRDKWTAASKAETAAGDALKAAKDSQFTEGHFDEPNVLAHVRMNDRTGPNGEKILHVEEVQSDWHQRGRRYGYHGEGDFDRNKVATAVRSFEDDIAKHDAEMSDPGITDKAEIDAVIQRGYQLDDRITAAARQAGMPDDLFFRHSHDGWHLILREPDGSGLTQAKAASPEAAMLGYDPRRREDTNAVPAAPFKSSWHELALKRVLRHAAENGYDKVTWTTGEQQAERYDLSKKISRIELTDNASGGIGQATMEGPFVHGQLRAFDHDGEVVIDRHLYDAKELPDLIGKEAADKLMNATPTAGRSAGHGVRRREIAGLDLKVGGEGMKGFYDKMLPAAANKIGKPFGAKVEKTKIDAGESTMEYHGPQVTEQREFQRIARELRVGDSFLAHQWHDVWTDVAGGKTFQEAMNWNGSIGLAEAIGGEMREAERHTTPVHAMDITPPMRQHAVEQGFPMFQRAPEEEPRTQAQQDILDRAADIAKGSTIGKLARRLLAPGIFDPSAKAAGSMIIKTQGDAYVHMLQVREKLREVRDAVGAADAATKEAFANAVDTGDFTGLSPELRRMAQGLKDATREETGRLQRLGQRLGRPILADAMEDYLGRYWKPRGETADTPESRGKVLNALAVKRPLTGPKSFLKARHYDTWAEARAAGLEPVFSNPVDAHLAKLAEMNRWWAGTVIAQAAKRGGFAMFFSKGAKRPTDWLELEGPEFQRQGATVIHEDGSKSHVPEGAWFAPEGFARVINNFQSKGAANTMFRDVVAGWRKIGNAMNSLQLGFSLFHPMFTSIDGQISRVAMGIDNMVAGHYGKAAAQIFEGLTPLNWVNNMKDGNRLLKSILRPEDAPPEMRRIVDAFGTAGGRVWMDRMLRPTDEGAIEWWKSGAFGTAFRDAARKYNGPLKPLKVAFNIVGRTFESTMAPIMDYMVPRQKLGVFSRMAQDWLERNPNHTDTDFVRNMQDIWESVDNRLGEMVYDNLFWDRTTKDIAHLLVRSVGWNMGSFREVPVGLADFGIQAANKLRGRDAEWTRRMSYFIALPAVTALYGAMYQYLSTGQGPQELKDYIFPRTGMTLARSGQPERVSIPSYAKDWYAIMTHPLQTIQNKTHPAVSMAAQMLSNKDYYGDIIRNYDDPIVKQVEDMVTYALKELQPFSIQATRKLFQEHSAPQASLGMLGFNPAPGYVTNPQGEENWQRKQHVKEVAKKTRDEARRDQPSVRPSP